MFEIIEINKFKIAGNFGQCNASKSINLTD